MENKKKINPSLLPGFLSRTFLRFFRTEASSGIVLILATGMALVLANSSFGTAYHHLWQSSFQIPILHKSVSLHSFINEGLMTFFFLMVGLEIRREFLLGELASLRKAAFPFFSALGGMLVPAGIYLMMTKGTAFSHGFGIPMATDIAFALGILSLLGKRVPKGIYIYLTSVAILDDIGGVLVIALFYTQSLSIWFLISALVAILLLAFLYVRKVRFVPIYFLAGLALWISLLFSGIHATLAGVILAFFLPHPKESTHSSQGESDSSNLQQEDNRAFSLEHLLHQVVSYGILPLFALCNAAILFPHNQMKTTLSHPLFFAVTIGLFVGKPIGIYLFSYLSWRCKIAHLPVGVAWKHIWATACLAGIGFTMSLFITEISFAEPHWQEIAKMGILCGSVLSAFTGCCFFILFKTTAPREA